MNQKAGCIGAEELRTGYDGGIYRERETLLKNGGAGLAIDTYGGL